MSTPAERPPMLRAKPAEPLTGGERFKGLDATVGEFWTQGFSDLRDNTLRGALAEFLVARAVGADPTLRVGWDNFGVLAPDETRIEVKSSGHLQSWAQETHSQLVFGRLTGFAFNAERTEYSTQRETRADVFVFAVQTCKDPDAYDMLDTSQWEFWVAGAEAILRAGTRTVGITWVRAHANGPHAIGELADAVSSAR